MVLDLVPNGSEEKFWRSVHSWFQVKVCECAGQLAGSLVATVWASALRSRGASGAHIVAPMLVSAAALEVAGRIASRLRRLAPVQASPGKSRSPLVRSP